MTTLDNLSVQLYTEDELNVTLADEDTLSVSLASDLSIVMKDLLWGNISGDIYTQIDLINLVKPIFEFLCIPFNDSDVIDVENPSYWKITSLEYINADYTVSHYYSAEEAIELINHRTCYLRFFSIWYFGEYFSFDYYEDLDSVIGKELENISPSNMPYALFSYIRPDVHLCQTQKSNTYTDTYLEYYKATLKLINENSDVGERHFLNEAIVTKATYSTEFTVIDCGTSNTVIGDYYAN